MSILGIVTAIAWFVWAIGTIILNWGDMNFWLPVGFVSLASIPFFIIAVKFWLT